MVKLAAVQDIIQGYCEGTTMTIMVLNRARTDKSDTPTDEKNQIEK